MWEAALKQFDAVAQEKGYWRQGRIFEGQDCEREDGEAGPLMHFP